MTLIIRIARIAGLPLKYSEGFNPKPRLVLPFPLPLGIASDYEIGEIVLQKSLSGGEFKDLMNSIPHVGFEILEAVPSQRKRSIASDTFYHDYRIEASDGFGPPSEFAAGITGVEERAGNSDRHESFYTKGVGHVFVRLNGSASIKKLLGKGETDAYLDYDIRRVKIWRSVNNTLSSFLQ
jgi:hypothetical protein